MSIGRAADQSHGCVDMSETSKLAFTELGERSRFRQSDDDIGTIKRANWTRGLPL
jgi:hypothetical protein